MIAKMLFTTLLQLLLAPLAESLEPYRHTKRSELHTRQETRFCNSPPPPPPPSSNTNPHPNLNTLSLKVSPAQHPARPAGAPIPATSAATPSTRRRWTRRAARTERTRRPADTAVWRAGHALLGARARIAQLRVCRRLGCIMRFRR
jgi:hypothetical protein